MQTAQVLLATRNGIKFIADQLASVERLTWSSIDICISDDGSDDGTRQFLESFCQNWKRGSAVLLEGPQQGSPGANFRSLILRAPGNADFIAFCDQDDIWLPDKLQRAAAFLNSSAPHVPALYCSRTTLVDAHDREIGMSPLFRQQPDFRNALVQSLAGGNTMVMNRSALQLLRSASERARYAEHDWWAYVMVTGAGGSVVYSSVPDTRYRQHKENFSGANQGWPARLRRLRELFAGRLKLWNDCNILAISACEDLLTDEARSVFSRFKLARKGARWRRLYHLKASGVFRQTLMAHVMLYIACALDLI